MDQQPHQDDELILKPVDDSNISELIVDVTKDPPLSDDVQSLITPSMYNPNDRNKMLIDAVRSQKKSTNRYHRSNNTTDDTLVYDKKTYDSDDDVTGGIGEYFDIA